MNFPFFQSLPFPAVTLCNFNAIRYDALFNSNFTDLIDTIKKQSKNEKTYLTSINTELVDEIEYNSHLVKRTPWDGAF